MSADSFGALHDRLMSVMSRLQVLKEVLTCDSVPNELAPAAYVLHDTTEDVIQLWDDFEAWHAGHEHTPRVFMSASEPPKPE